MGIKSGFENIYEWTYLWAVRPPQAFIRSASDSLLSINEKQRNTVKNSYKIHLYFCTSIKLHH